MGWGVRVIDGVRRQQENTVWDIVTVQASVGGHEAPHRRGKVTIGKSGSGRGYLA